MKTPLRFSTIVTVAARGLFLSLLLAATVPLFGQYHTLRIESPPALSADYEMLIAGFGPGFCEVESLSGELILIEDGMGGTLGCDTIVNDLSGKIAVIDRGDCNFSLKVLHAQEKGAQAVIVCQNSTEDIFIMAGGDFGNEVTIPSFMISRADCAAFRDGIADGISVSIDRELPAYADAVVVWGDDPGEGDFAGGLNDWTVNNLSCQNNPAGDFELWRWDSTGLAPNGSCSAGEIFSPTKCNGAMVFESDFYDNGGAGCTVAAGGTGPCPADQIGELISPAIDLTASDAEAFSLRFYQDTRQFQSNYWVGWSADNGQTWDSVLVNIDIAVNDFNLPSQRVIAVPLEGVENTTSDLRIKFRYEANYYYWIIDDVQVIEQEANNLRVNSNFFAVPPNAVTPLGQVSPIPFLADIENVGAETQTDVVLDLIIEDEQGTQVYFDSLEYGDVPGNTLVENIPFDNTYTPQMEGTFTGTYKVKANEEDFDTLNNTQQFTFEVSDTVFAKEFGATTLISPAASNWDAGAPHQAGYGNFFYVPNGGDYIRSISFGIGNAEDIAGNSLVIAVYKWLGDTNEDGLVDPDEREFVDFNFYQVDGTEEPTDIITIPFPETASDPIQLEDNTGYIVMVQYVPPDDQPELDFLIPWSDEIDYGAMVFANELTGVPQFAGLTALGGDLSVEPFNTIGFGFNLVPVIRMNIGADPSTSREDVQALRTQFVSFPNPASDRINIQLQLEETAQSARVRIFDMSGRLMLQRFYNGIRREQFSYDLSSWQNGTYFIELSTEAGTGTRRFILSKN